MGFQQGNDITVAACQSTVQHMWERRCDVNKTLIVEASVVCSLGIFLFFLHGGF